MYRTIVVHLDRTPSASTRLDLALSLAERCGAHLHAVFAIADPALPGFGSRHRLVSLVPEAADQEQQFHETTAHRGISSSWRTLVSAAEIGVSQDLILAARFADLIMAGQFEPGVADGMVPPDLVDQLIMRSGAPVLVVPFAGRFTLLDERALVAWNGSREAARALRDALPLLALASHVTILALAPGNEASDPTGEGVSQVLAYLHRHGIAAEADRLIFDPNAINAAERLLSHLADAGAGLLVMGGPGVAMRKAQAKRSLTRQVLSQLTVPMLVSY
jgi:nucleotide-binding universal stress UspA family protein